MTQMVRMKLKPKLHELDKDELIRLMKLPNHLRETMLAVIALREGTATEVSEQTGKSRSSESDYLNQLERMGYLKRRYASRKIYFSPT
jgi:DNA-binding transcriptional ArsR family regulator